MLIGQLMMSADNPEMMSGARGGSRRRHWEQTGAQSGGAQSGVLPRPSRGFCSHDLRPSAALRPAPAAPCTLCVTKGKGAKMRSSPFAVGFSDAFLGHDTDRSRCQYLGGNDTTCLVALLRGLNGTVVFKNKDFYCNVAIAL